MKTVKIIIPEPKFTIFDKFFFHKKYGDDLKQSKEDPDPLELYSVDYFHRKIGGFSFCFDSFDSNLDFGSGDLEALDRQIQLDLSSKGEYRYYFCADGKWDGNDTMSEDDLTSQILEGNIIHETVGKLPAKALKPLGSTNSQEISTEAACSFVTGYCYDILDNIQDVFHYGYFNADGHIWGGEGVEEYPSGEVSRDLNPVTIMVNSDPRTITLSCGSNDPSETYQIYQQYIFVDQNYDKN
jgi:hypothetical protein